MKHKLLTAVALSAGFTLLLTSHSSLAGTNSLIVKFNAGHPYAFNKVQSHSNRSAQLPAVSALNAQYNLRSYRALWRSHTATVQNIYRLDFPDHLDLARVREAYTRCPGVAYAEYDTPLYPLGDPITITPNDYWWNHAFNYDNHLQCSEVTGDSLGWQLWYLKASSVDRAWTITTGSEDVVVAVIDAGFDTTNPELRDLLYRNPGETYNGADEDSSGYVDDVYGYDFADQDSSVMPDSHWWQRWECARPDTTPCGRCWNISLQNITQEDYEFCFGGDSTRWALDGFGAQRHGMQMASIISSVANNNDGHRGDVVGYNWHVKILPLKIGKAIPATVPEYADWNTPAKLSVALEALQYVKYMKTHKNVNIRVLNMSMEADRGGDFAFVPAGPLSDLTAIIQDIRAAGVLPVGGAGNGGRPLPVLPCRIPGCFCAAAVYPDSGRHKWTDVDKGSNFGTGGTDPVNHVPYEGVDICGYTQNEDLGIPDAINHRQGVMTPGFEPWENPYWSYCAAETGVVFQDSVSMHVSGITPMRTSGTTAQASGMAAMLASLHPEMTPDQLEAEIKRGADPVDADYYYSGQLGAGAINAYKTLTLWGDITQNTSLTGKVWVSGTVSVAEGDTLTIAAGTEIFVAPDNVLVGSTGDPRSFLDVYGHLNIAGTAENPVRIHSWAKTVAPGDWGAVVVGTTGTATLSHVIVKHATWGISVGGRATLQDCLFDSCSTGVFAATSGNDTSLVLRNVVCKHGTYGYYIIGGRSELDGCAADSNTYGIYLVDGKVHAHGGTRAHYNTLDGIRCIAETELGPDVSTRNNGRHGVYISANVLYPAAVWRLDGISSEDNVSAGIRVDTPYASSRAEIANSALRRNSRNAVAMAQARVVLGDIGASLGMGNSLTDPGVYDVYNGVSGVQLKAESCYWMECVEGALPQDPTFFGAVDWEPYLCADPNEGKAYARTEVPRASWSSLNYPNPFNPSTRIDYYVAESGAMVRISIYDLLGKSICRLVEEREPRGEHSVVWAGHDELGRRAASGVYFYRVQIGARYEHRGKMSLIK